MFLIQGTFFVAVSNSFSPQTEIHTDDHAPKSLIAENSEHYSDKVSITEGTATENVPIQKNAEINDVSVSLSSVNSVETPTLSITNEKLWEFSQKYGSFGSMNRIEGKNKSQLNLTPGEEKIINMTLPISEIKKGSFYVERAEKNEQYDVEIDLGETNVWKRSDDDDLFGSLEQMASVSGTRALDYTTTENGSYLLAGSKSGELRIIDAKTGVELAKATVDGKWIKEAVFIQNEDNRYLKGAFLESMGNVYRFTCDLNTQNISYQLITKTDNANDVLLTHDITANDWDDLITTRENEILAWMSNGTNHLNNFTTVKNSSQQPKDVSGIANNQIITTSYNSETENSTLSIFEYVDGGLNNSKNHTINRDVLELWKAPSKNESNLKFVTSIRDNNFEVWKEVDGNLTQLKHLENSHSVSESDVGDVTGNALSDIAIVYHLSDYTRIYTNEGSKFTQNYSFYIDSDAGGYKVKLLDVEKDGDQDILMASNENIYLARNRLLWKKEPVSNLAEGIESYFASSNVTYDEWGNPMVKVPLTIHSEYGANLTLSDLNIEYNYTPTINITQEVKDYVSTHPGNETGWVNVPLNLTADNDEGEINVDVDIDYGGRAPVLEKPIRDTYEVVTGEFAEGVIDLSSYYQDPNDLDVDYLVSYMENESRLGAFIDENKVTFTSKGYTGKYDFRVKAVNSEGYVQESNTFTVKVIPPPPELDLPDEYKVRASQRTWFNISEYASNYENKGEVGLSTDSDSVTPHPDNMTLEMYYTEENITEEVEISLTVDNSTASDTINVTTTPYDVPLFEPLPDIFLERDENLSKKLSFNLYDHISHPQEPVENLNYSLFWEDDRYINLGIEDGWILGWINETYTGSSNVEVEVTDSEGHTDDITFELIVNNTKYPPEYIDGLEDVTVEEGDEWTVNLANYFEYEEQDDLLYQSNKAEVQILNGSWAAWEPDEDSADLTDVVFTARLLSYPELKASSDSINLFFEEKPPFPQYTGGLYSRVVQPDEGWQLNLSDFFNYEEGEDRLRFSTNKEEIDIDEINGTAKWYPEDGDSNLRNVTFTAYDVENTSRRFTTKPINLVLTSDGTPESEIISITPENPTDSEKIHFVGKANDSLGNTTYRWTSSIDGHLSDKKEFESELSPGEHVIKLEVKDLRGNWSKEDSVIFEVEEPQQDQKDFISFFNSTNFRIVLAIIIVGLTLNYIGNYLLSPEGESFILSIIRNKDEENENKDSNHQ